MNKDKLKQINFLSDRIDEIKSQIKELNNQLSEPYKPRLLNVKWSGNFLFDIPESLHKIICKIVYLEYKDKLQKLEKEFNDL